MRLFFTFLFLFSSFISFSQECSLFFNGTNYQFSANDKKHVLKAEWKNDRIIIEISIPSLVNEKFINQMKVEIVGNTEGTYIYNDCDVKKNKQCSSSLYAKWIDDSENKKDINTLDIKETINGKINVRKIESGKISCNFYVVYNDITVEGVVRNLIVENLK